MDMERSEQTISLWDDGSKKTVTLKNLKTKKQYSFVLRHSLVIGRIKEYCDLQVTTEDRYISGKHLRFVNNDTGVYVEDLHSKNGTRVNGKLISSRTRIRKGDILRIGRSEFEVTY